MVALATMSPAQLRAEWRRVYRALPPALASDLMRRGIAYRLQERAQGGLPAAIERELDRAGKRMEQGASLPAGEVRLKAGTRLVRSWKGKTYSVLVAENGFVFADRRLTSLSQIAELITGAHWSGPRFFGIKPRAGAGGPIATGAQSVSRSGAKALDPEVAHG